MRLTGKEKTIKELNKYTIFTDRKLTDIELLNLLDNIPADCVANKFIKGRKWL